MKATYYDTKKQIGMDKPRVDRITIRHEQDTDADNRGEWHAMGIIAEAEVSYTIGGTSRRIEHFTSGGLWGIESDSGQEYIEEVEQEQLADLKEHLERFGVDTSNWGELVAHAERRRS